MHKTSFRAAKGITYCASYHGSSGNRDVQQEGTRRIYIRNAKQVGISEPFFPRVSRSFTKLFFCNQVNLCTHPGLQLVERCTARADRSQAMKCLGFAFKGPISWDFWASHKKKTSNNIKRIKAKGSKQGLMTYVYICTWYIYTCIYIYPCLTSSVEQPMLMIALENMPG